MNKCVDCSKEIYKTSKRCTLCYHEWQKSHSNKGQFTSERTKGENNYWYGKGEEKEYRPGIQSLLKQKKAELSWSNLVDQLKEMTKIGVIEVRREKSRKNYYRLSEDGRIIKKWLHKIKLINDGWM